MLVPAVPESKIGPIFDPWSGYHYRGIGDESLKLARTKEFRPPPVGPLETADNVRKWLATGIPNDPNEMIEQMKYDTLQAKKLGTSCSDILDEPGKLPPSRQD